MSELLNQAWSKKDKDKRAPNLLAFIDRFNKTSLWVASMIVLPEDVIRRASVLSHFVKVAKVCVCVHVRACVRAGAFVCAASAASMINFVKVITVSKFLFVMIFIDVGVCMRACACVFVCLFCGWLALFC